MKQSDWISVKERLPERRDALSRESIDVLFTDGHELLHGTHNLISPNKAEHWYIYRYGKTVSPEKITHWMPEPELPEVEE